MGEPVRGRYAVQRRFVQTRLQKILASAGLTSRRRAEELIERGLVTVNGTVARLGDVADPETDLILVDGRPVSAEEHLYLALHKPLGYVTSTVSLRGEPTVLDLIPAGPRVFPVGRLDRDTSGLLLLTNDGAWANLVTHPRYEVPKEYHAVVRGLPSQDAIASLRGGMILPDGTVTSPAHVAIVRRATGSTALAIIVHEGKKRQIRQMLAVVGCPILQLQRVAIGAIKLGTLRPGGVRRLTAEEVQSICDRALQSAQ
jgi:23S rRNA pseudouridine2605 synthase